MLCLLRLHWANRAARPRVRLPRPGLRMHRARGALPLLHVLRGWRPPLLPLIVRWRCWPPALSLMLLLVAGRSCVWACLPLLPVLLLVAGWGPRPVLLRLLRWVAWQRWALCLLAAGWRPSRSGRAPLLLMRLLRGTLRRTNGCAPGLLLLLLLRWPRHACRGAGRWL